MDNKKNRYRARSGNTFRICNTRGSHLYKRQSYLVSQSTCNINQSVIGDLGFDKDNVAYSLNKKGRWLIPQMFERELTNSEENFKVNFVECHKLKRKVKHTENDFSDGFPKEDSSQKTYFDLSSLKCKTSARTVNIVTTRPTTNSFARNSKYLDSSETPQDGSETPKTSHKQTKYLKVKTNTLRTKMFINMAMDEYPDESDFFDNENGYDDSDKDTYKPRPYKVCVGDILLHSNDRQKMFFRDSVTSKPIDLLRKPYDEHPPGEEPEMEKGETGEHSKTLPPLAPTLARYITIFIPKTEVLTRHLQEVFGEDYVECRCLPRKFVIDITEKVTRTIFKSKAFQNRNMKRFDLSAVLVFAYDMFGGLDSTDMDSFKVSLNMKTTQSCLKLDTLPENDVFGIEETIERAVSYVATIPFDNFVYKDKLSSKAKPVKTSHNTMKLFTTEITSVCPKNFTLRDIMKESRKELYTSVRNVDVESPPPETCSICFEFISSESPATALQTCGHWFCDNCWNNHVISTVSNSTGRIMCPGYKCQSTVDYDILLTTSNIEIVGKIFQRQIHRETERDSCSKWCPNKKCGRVIRYKNKETEQTINVTCECGTAFCFDCLQHVHWPLSCLDHKCYLKKLKEHGNIDKVDKFEEVFTFSVRGKRCPVCNTFIEKKGGCFSIKCICGTRFCWGCLNTSGSHPTCYRGDMYGTAGDSFRTKTKNIIQRINEDSYADQPDWYKRAVVIRSWRNPSKVTIMSSAVRTMCRTLTSYKRRQGTGIGAELENFEVSDSHQYSCVTDKIHPFLKSMIDVYLEASVICEHTTVFKGMCEDQSIITKQDCLKRLIEEIHTVFRASNNEDLKSSISSLFHLRLQCENVLNTLIDTVTLKYFKGPRAEDLT